jgi:DDE superfamily endonuclease/Transposase
MRPISEDIISQILQMLNDQKSAHAISLATGIGTSTITRLHKKHYPHIHVSSGGHPPKLSDTNIRHAAHLLSSGKADTAVDVTKTLSSIISQPLSAQTTRRYLKKHGLKAAVKQKKPLLSKRHRKDHLDFALAHQYWTMDDWKRVVWSDETKINHLGSDGRKWVWKKPGEGLSDRLVQGTQKFGGGSLMVWGCMMWEGPGFATRIDGRMDASLFTDILEEDLQASLQFYHKNPQEIEFQQDNDPKHTSRKAKEWFKTHDIKVMTWPAQSPDLNPIEHLWDHLKRKLGEYGNAPGGMQELWERVSVEWEKIGADVCQKLIESMPRRVDAVIRAKGGYTKY